MWSLLELAVDVALVTHEPDLCERMAAFEQSQILKAAFKYRDFVSRHKDETPDDPLRLAYIPNNERRIEDLRLKHWGSDKHPDSWFGPSFPLVAAEADRRVGSEFERFYFDHFDRLCWGTHGTTLMLVRSAPADMLPQVSTMALLGAIQLTLDLVDRALKFFGEDAVTIEEMLAARMLHGRNELRIGALASTVQTAERELATMGTPEADPAAPPAPSKDEPTTGA